MKRGATSPVSISHTFAPRVFGQMESQAGLPRRTSRHPRPEWTARRDYRGHAGATRRPGQSILRGGNQNAERSAPCRRQSDDGGPAGNPRLCSAEQRPVRRWHVHDESMQQENAKRCMEGRTNSFARNGKARYEWKQFSRATVVNWQFPKNSFTRATELLNFAGVESHRRVAGFPRET